MLRSDYCSLLQTLPVLCSLTSLDLSDLDLCPKNNRLMLVKQSPPQKRLSCEILGPSSGDESTIADGHVPFPVENWDACAAVLQALPLHRFTHFGFTVEPSADTLCRALAIALSAVSSSGSNLGISSASGAGSSIYRSEAGSPVST